jgi:NAD(P)-dependent dehydrogenase (short-subunit alcohol dehydrogenase family)
MIAWRSGKIINTAADEELAAHRVPYTAAKGSQAADAMAIELAAHNIQVNAISPATSQPRMSHRRRGIQRVGQ